MCKRLIMRTVSYQSAQDHVSTEPSLVNQKHPVSIPGKKHYGLSGGTNDSSAIKLTETFFGREK